MSVEALVLSGDALAIPEEEASATTVKRRESYPQLVARLSRQSVVKHFDAYADIAWDSHDFRIERDDPRWQLPSWDSLGATEWYRSQPEARRAEIGLHLIASFAKIGQQFENVLKRGLLDFAFDLPNGSIEYRYVYHETIEEAHHGLMFQEFVNRTGLPIDGLPAWMRVASRQVVRLARRFPELFFMFVLGGEDPIDHFQRRLLHQHPNAHPLLRRIMQIHVTEEARHLCFARHYLRQHVPSLRGYRRFALAYRTPLLLSRMAGLMMEPPPALVRHYQIPKAVLDAAYRRNPEHHRQAALSLAKVRDLCVETGLMTPTSERLWRRLGIWAA